MRRKKILSYESRIIVSIILAFLSIFLLYQFFDNLSVFEDKLIDLYLEYISIYPIWAQVSIFITPILIYIIIVQIRKNRSKYTEDIIYDIDCKWEWKRDEIINLQCFCPVCSNELYYNMKNANGNNKIIDKIDFICDNCNKVISSIPNSNNYVRSSINIKKELERVIRKRLVKHS